MLNLVKKNKHQCDLCKGIGFLENKDLYCYKCDTYRCKFTNNINIEEFYKYKFCEICENNEYDEKNSKIKIDCIKCSGKGFYINNGVICNTCEIPHKICNCIIKPFFECNKCCSLGTIE